MRVRRWVRRALRIREDETERGLGPAVGAPFVDALPDDLLTSDPAGLWRDGTPTPVLRDRVQTAANLYFDGKAEKLLMSGDNRFVNYNEPEAMRQYALTLGVPENAIVLDYAGRRTYDTCYRARDIFGVKSAILVTQGFHLPRALFLCNMLGVDGVGVPADIQYYRKVSRLIWNFREVLATLDSINDIFYKKPLPVLGNPEPIFSK